MLQAFQNYSDFSGRAGRSEYWLFQLLNVIVIAVSVFFVLVGLEGDSFQNAAHSGGAGGMFLMGVVMLVFWLLTSFIPNIAVHVRRFHDHNISGWWYVGLVAVGMIPYVGILANLALLWVVCRGGTWGPNNYGPDPVNPWRGNTTFA